MTRKIGMVSLGCSKNQVDAEWMLAVLRHGGYELSANPAECDAVIINTCGFIESAKQESIENILEFCRLKEQGKLRVVAVTGCLAERYRDQVADEIPEADVVLGIGSNEKLLESLDRAFSGEKVRSFGEKDALPLEGERVLSNLPFYAYLKVADGCDNCCTYCAIPLIRGHFRSRPIEKVVAEAERLVAQGVTELNVVAQDTTRYGEDLYGKLMLPELLRRLCKIEGVRWVRVLYCYPERITDELLETMASEPKVVRYMDLPIQHANGEILHAMNRRGDAQMLAALLEKIRAKLPGVVLRTTLITGFPGETEQQFTELCEFIRAMKFERLGCFTYSQEEDTPAAELPDQIEEQVKQRRAELVMELQYDVMEAFNRSMIGQVLPVAVEGREGGRWYGRSYMDAPDIDSRVYFTGRKRLQPGDYVEVKIDGAADYDLSGKAIEE